MAIRPRSTVKAIRTVIRFAIALLVFWLILWTGCEYQTSSHEVEIAAKVVERGGYINRVRTIDELIETALVDDKPVKLWLAETTLARFTFDRLGFRIQSAVFLPGANSEFAAILRQSTGLAQVAFAGSLNLNAQDSAPVPIVEAFGGRFLQLVGFERYKFTHQDVLRLSESLNTHHIIFVNCSFPADVITNLGHVKGLNEVQINQCNIDGSPQAIKNSIESLRSAGIVVTYE